MRRSRVINTAMFLLPLVATACGSSEEAPKISEDQMNHYAGVPEHDHPTNSSTSAPPPAGYAGPGKKQ
jgi:hypothetical protein